MIVNYTDKLQAQSIFIDSKRTQLDDYRKQ